MLGKADTNPRDVIGKFSAKGIPVAFISPTATGLDKSILDAIAPLRSLLSEAGIHDYEKQGQGPEYKVKVDAEFIGKASAVPTTASLYRPETKNGDPRIWFAGLSTYSKPGNLLAVVAKGGRLYVINASDPEILETINDLKSPLGRLAESFHAGASGVAEELLGRIQTISKMLYVPTVRPGDTGVGATLETLLGIKANSSKAPDYMGIEIKASRHEIASRKAKNRVNLFSQVPDWSRSPVGSARAMLDAYGYPKEGRQQLYCTVSSAGPNSQGLALSLESEQEVLWLLGAGREGAGRNQMCWRLGLLRNRLAEKHPESFWVKASSKIMDAKEHFHYYKVVHTAKPVLSNLQYLLADGTVTLDLTMSEKGAKGVRDHGYLFKIWPEDFSKIFPDPRIYDLTKE